LTAVCRPESRSSDSSYTIHFFRVSPFLRLAVFGFVVAASGAATAAPSPAQNPTRDQPAQTPSVQGSAVVSGRILVVQGGQAAPVRRAHVTVSSEKLPQPVTVDTDTEGRYRVDGLPAGAFQLTAEKPGFIMAGDGGSRGPSRPVSISLTTGQRQMLDILMQRGAAVEGRLLSTLGEPAVNASVSAFRFAYGPTGRQSAIVTQVRTDDVGHYRIHTLPPGDYYLYVAPDQLAPLLQAQLPGERPPGLAGTYYPGSTNVDEAKPVSVAVGQELSNVDFSIASVPVANVTAKIIDSAGNAVKSFGARLQTPGRLQPPFAGTLVMENGSAIYQGLPPGEYWLTIATIATSNGEPEYAAQRVTVAGRDISDLTVATAKGATINGRVEVEGATAVPSGVQVLAYEAEYDMPNIPGRTAAPITVARDGTFSFPSLFGSRVLRLGKLPDEWAITSVWVDDVEATDTATDFRAGDKPKSVRIVATSSTAAVSGTVADGRGQPSRSRVVVFSEDEQHWGPRSRYVRATDAGADGKYVVPGLLPGKYLVAAVSDLDEGAWLDPSVLRSLRANASPVSVAEREKVTLALRRRDSR